MASTTNKTTELLKSLLKFALFLSVGLGILYFVYQNQEAGYQKECSYKATYDCEGQCEHTSLLGKLVSDFAGADVFWLFMVCVAFMISNLSRSLRWCLLIRQLDGGKYRPRWYNAFWATMVGYLVNLALPRAGEFAKPATLSQYEKLPLDKLIGTIVTDRIMDVLMLLLVVGLTFLFQFQNIYNFLSGKGVEPPKCNATPPVVEAAATLPLGLILGGMVLAGLLGLLLLYLLRHRLMKLSIAKKIMAMALNFADGIKTVFALRRYELVWFLVHTVVIWLMYFFMTYLCFFAYAPTSGLSPMAGLLVFVFGSFGVVVPSPGGMGAYQIATTAALVIYGVSKADAFAFSNIVFFTINLFCNIIFGVLAYILLPIINRGYKPSWAKQEEIEKNEAENQ